MTQNPPPVFPSRIAHAGLRQKIMCAEDAAALIENGDHVGMSGFTGAGYPKAIPLALAKHIQAHHDAGKEFRIGVWTGASTAPELDGALAKVGGMDMRLPYQSDPTCRARINDGEMAYIDIHLSHVAQFVWFGFLGKLDVAVDRSGRHPARTACLIPSSSVGNNKTWLEQADKRHPGGQPRPAADGAGRHARHLLRHASARLIASRFR